LFCQPMLLLRNLCASCCAGAFSANWQHGLCNFVPRWGGSCMSGHLSLIRRGSPGSAVRGRLSPVQPGVLVSVFRWTHSSSAGEEFSALPPHSRTDAAQQRWLRGHALFAPSVEYLFPGWKRAEVTRVIRRRPCWETLCAHPGPAISTRGHRNRPSAWR